MGRYLLRRLGFALLLVFIVSSASLLLTRLAPGDITTDQALTLDPDARERLRADLGLDRPLAAQYLSWLAGVVQFDFGRSLLYSRPVSTLVSPCWTSAWPGSAKASSSLRSSQFSRFSPGFGFRRISSHSPFILSP